MDNRSLEALLEETLRDASAEHHLQVILANEKHGDWAPFYARFMAKRLAPIFAGIQGVSFTVDGAALPPFYSRQTQDEIGAQYTSRYHTGE